MLSRSTVAGTPVFPAPPLFRALTHTWREYTPLSLSCTHAHTFCLSFSCRSDLSFSRFLFLLLLFTLYITPLIVPALTHNLREHTSFTHKQKPTHTLSLSLSLSLSLALSFSCSILPHPSVLPCTYTYLRIPSGLSTPDLSKKIKIRHKPACRESRGTSDVYNIMHRASFQFTHGFTSHQMGLLSRRGEGISELLGYFYLSIPKTSRSPPPTIFQICDSPENKSPSSSFLDLPRAALKHGSKSAFSRLDRVPIEGGSSSRHENGKTQAFSYIISPYQKC